MSQDAPRRDPRFVLALFAGALALRLLYLWEISASPFGPPDYLPIDAHEYHQWAVDWLYGSWPPHQTFFRPPLYTLFIGVLYAVTGPHPVAVLVVQAVLGAASCLLTYGIAMELFGERRTARTAGLICALTGPLIYFDAQLLSGSLDVFLQLAALRLLLWAGRSEGLAPWLASGVAIGLSAVLRGPILLFLALVLPWIAWLPAPASQRVSRTTRRALALCLPVGLCLLPVGIHNLRWDAGPPGSPPSAWPGQILHGEFVAVAANAGINFYLGNHASLREMNRLDHPDHFAVYERIRREPWEHGLVSSGKGNGYLLAETLRDIARWPREWLGLMATKLGELLNGAEIPRNTSLYADREYSWVLSALMWKYGLAFPTGLLLPLAALGILLSRHSVRRHFPVWASLGSQSFFVVAFFVTSRYRLPMLPLLGVYSAHAALHLRDAWRERRKQEIRALASLAVLLLVLCNLGVGLGFESHHAIDHYNRAAAYLAAGDREKASRQLIEALRKNPQHLDSLLALCKLLLDEGEPEKAFPLCSQAVVADPSSAAAHYLVGSALEALGRGSEAVAPYRRAVKLEPGNTRLRDALEHAKALRRKSR